jgi:hypothetical protein
MRRFDQANDLEPCIRSAAEKGASMVLIILPNRLREFYKRIKRLCVNELGLVTQVVLEETLRRRGFKPICEKLIL